MLLWQAFLAYGGAIADSPLSRTTITNHKSQVKQYHRWLQGHVQHDPRCDEVSSPHLRAYLTGKGQTVAPGTLYQYDASLRHFTAWMVAEGYLLSDPMLKLARPKNVRGRRILPLPEVVAKLRDCSRLIFDPYRRALSDAALTLMMDCALRPGETLSLTLSDYDRAAKTLMVRKAKGNKGRHLPLPDFTARCLNAHLAMRPKECKHTRLLCVDRGHWLGRDGLLNILQERLHLAGHVEAEHGHVTPHAMRAVAATKLLKSGANLREVMEILGHTSLHATQVYLSTTPDDLRRAMERAITGGQAEAIIPERQKREERARFHVDRRRRRT